MSHTRQEQMEAFGRFLDILDELRVKSACLRRGESRYSRTSFRELGTVET